MTAQRWKLPLCLSLLLVSTSAMADETVVPVETPVAAWPLPDTPPAPVVRRTVDAAAARLLWNDPAIRNFIGLSENAQDFTDPDAIPGFGRLAPAALSPAR